MFGDLGREWPEGCVQGVEPGRRLTNWRKVMEPITLRTLLDAGVHFGHQTRRWNPKMKPYIFTQRNGIYILDLKQTIVALDEAFTFVSDLARKGGRILFVGTKKQAQQTIVENATRCNMPYVNSRWLGGMLTNFVTISERVRRMTELEAMDADGRMASLPKKEQVKLHKELDKLRINLEGIRDMKTLPQALFVVDTKREEIAVKEARRLGIPVIGMLDTNADPDEVDYGIPSNDDAIRSISLVSELIAEAVLDGVGANPVDESDFTEGDAAASEQTAAAEASGAEAAAETPAAEAPAETPAAEASDGQ